MTDIIEQAQSVYRKEKLSLPKDLKVMQPIGVELFLDTSGKQSNLPEAIAENPVLLEQATERRALHEELDTLFTKVGNVHLDIEDAIDTGVTTAAEVAHLYDGLTDFLKTDENNARIILYFPFQLLPNLKSKKQLPEELVRAQNRFGDRYKKAWIRLLYESDVRASFVDGDVLEPGLGDPVRVRKAGHITPELLKRGIVDIRNVIDILEISDDQELLRSLAEGVLVAKDTDLIPAADWQTIQHITQEKLGTDVMQPSVVEKRGEEEPQGFEQIMNRLDAELVAIDTKYQDGSAYVLGMSNKRAVWEKGVQQDEQIDLAVQGLVDSLQKGDITIQDIETYCESRGWTSEYYKIIVGSITQTGERYAVTDVEKARVFAQENEGVIEKIWKSGSKDAQDALVSGLSHWKHLDIIGSDYLDTFGIRLPDLSKPFPVDLEELTRTDLQQLILITQKIKENPALSKLVYPFVLAFGSRLKGYAGLTADIDAALFIKPAVGFEKREEVRTKLQEEIPEVAAMDKLNEFWVQEKDGKLGFRNVPDDSRTVVGAPQVHFLLGGVWVSAGDEYKKLYGDMLAKYLDLSRFDEQKEEVRTHLLRQIELDILQFRLMHKGYKRFYPSKKEPGTEHAKSIDWESDFWDAGYRRVATKLFLSRVFLPDLSSGD